MSSRYFKVRTYKLSPCQRDVDEQEEMEDYPQERLFPFPGQDGILEVDARCERGQLAIIAHEQVTTTIGSVRYSERLKPVVVSARRVEKHCRGGRGSVRATVKISTQRYHFDASW